MELTKSYQTEKISVGSGKSEQRNIASGNMDAIAHGVQVRLDESTSFSRRVTEETVNTARVLGVPNSIIDRWLAQRLNHLAQETERLRQIKSLLNRTYRNVPDWMTKTRV
jgi:hypothetical protein